MTLKMMIERLKWALMPNQMAMEAVHRARKDVEAAAAAVFEFGRVVQQSAEVLEVHAHRVAVLEKALCTMLNASYEERKRIIDSVMSKEKQDAVVRMQ